MIYKTIYLTKKCTDIILADEVNQGDIISKLDEETFRTM